MNRVCCIIVTYNRLNYLKCAISALENQTLPPRGYIIVNNDSSDGTDAYLKEKCQITNTIDNEFVIGNRKDITYYYYKSDVNLGGAGGFKIGFMQAQVLRDKYDYFWVMDDDVEPTNSCLETMLRYNVKDHLITVPKRIGEGFKDLVITKYRFNNPFVHIFFDRWVEAKRIERETLPVKAFTFEGPLFRNTIIEKVGSPDDTYFIQSDDFDYAFRCLQFSDILYCKNAILKRQIPVITDYSDKNYWRMYYGIRNESILDLKYSKNILIGKWKVFNHRVRWFFVGILHNNSTERQIVNKAFADALSGKTGKTINPGEV